jgi:hypothetical protein
LILCERAIQEEATRNLSLINLVESIEIASLPATVPFEVVSHWRLETEDMGKPMQFEISLVGEDGTEVRNPTHTLTAETPTLNLRVRNILLPEKEGTYKINARMRRADATDWVEAVPWCINLKLQQSTKPEVAQSKD